MSPKDDERVELRVPLADLERWRATAAVENLSVAEWLRRLGNRFAVDQATIDTVKRKAAERAALLAQGRSPTYPDYPVVPNPNEQRNDEEHRREESKKKLKADLAAAKKRGGK